MSVRPFVGLHGTSRLLLDGFSWNLIFDFFENASTKFQFLYTLIRITGTLHEDQCTFLVVSRSVLLRMRNVSGKSCRQNQNTHFILNNFFFLENLAVYEIMWKNIYSRRGHIWQCGACVLHAGYLRLYTHAHTHTHTLRICNTYFFSTAKVVTHTHLIVTLYVHCLSCLTWGVPPNAPYGLT